MALFTWRQRATVYGTNLAVIGTAAFLGWVVDTFVLHQNRYWATIACTLLSFPLALWLTVRRVRSSIKPT